jgi:iron complex outermembrane recepter protein
MSGNQRAISKDFRSRTGLISGSSIALMLSAGVHAQTPTSASSAAPAAAVASDSNGAIGDIVVYSSKKSVGQRAQSLPAGITAVSGQTLERTQTRDISDLQKFVPNASLRGAGTTPGYPNFEIRGIGISSTVRSVDPAINIVQDGMVIGYPMGAVLNTFDLESVEVLRGPQGVLFGRNASGGAVVVRTRLPGEKFRFIGDVSYGNFNEVQLRASVEGAIAPGIRAKIAVSQRWNDGYYKNTLGGTFVPAPFNPSGQPVQHGTGAVNNNEFIIKPTIVFDLADDVTFTLFTQYMRFRDAPGYFYAITPPGTTTGLQTKFGFTPPTEKYTMNLADVGYNNIDAGHAIGQFDWKVGPGTFTAVAAYRKIRSDHTNNSDGTPFNLTIFPDNIERNHQVSLETRYAGNLTNKISFVVGTFLYRSTDYNLEKRKLSGVLLGRPLGTFATQQTIWDQVDKSAAAFGNVDWEVTPSLTISGGLRYSYEKKAFDIVPLALCAGPGDFQGCPTTVVSKQKSWSDVSPRAVASWKITNRNLLYASYAKGFRSGNFNGRATSANAIGPTNPESNTSYEIGSKNEFLDGHVRLNITGFYEDFKDIERTVQTVVNNQPVQTLANAASATVKGVEGELSLIPFEGFRIDGNVGLTDAKYKSFVGLVGLPAGKNATDLKFDRLSKWRYTIGAQYDWNLLDGAWTANASYTWRSAVFTDVLNTPQLKQPAYGLLDAGLSYKHGNFRYALYGRNLTNKLYAVAKSLGFNYFAFGGEPRTYGVRVGVEF